jgi:Glycosyltransferase family 87
MATPQAEVLTPETGPRAFAASLRSFIDRRLERDMVRFVCTVFLTINLILAAIAFLTFDGTRTIFGVALGADFTGFYAAGKIFNEHPADRVYDLELQDRVLHELLPGLSTALKLPFVYPPFFALLFRPLVLLPYAWACLIWMLLSVCLYFAGFALIWRSCPSIPGRELPIALLLALSFQPFFECILSGQASAFGFLAMAMAIRCETLGLPFRTGLCLALCLYKPPLLLLFIPMLAVARRWRVLGGFVAGAVVLAGVSVLAVGERGCLAYAHLAVRFSRLINSETTAFPMWKFIDLNNFLGSLMGHQAVIRGALFIAGGLLMLPWLVRLWFKYDHNNRDQQALLWSSTLTSTLSLNYYIGLYDAVLAVPGVMLTTDILCRRVGGIKTALSPGLRYLLALLYLVPWFSQHMARSIGLQPLTLVLTAVGVYQVTLARRATAARGGESVSGLGLPVPSPVPATIHAGVTKTRSISAGSKD